MMTTRRPLRGYTLLELIVSVGLFSMVMVIVMGVYLALISYDRQARATNELVSNLSFALESMARNIRTGTHYQGGSTAIDCDAPVSNLGTDYTSLSFCDSQGEKVHYRLNTDGTIGQCTGTGVIGCSNSNGTATPLTDPRIMVSSILFRVRGVGTTGTEAVLQPYVTIRLVGTMATDAGKSIEFVIQTSAAQRVLDIP